MSLVATGQQTHSEEPWTMFSGGTASGTAADRATESKGIKTRFCFTSVFAILATSKNLERQHTNSSARYWR